MIITEFISVLITNKNRKYYINKGYDINNNGYYTINISDLNKNSHTLVEVSCDTCHENKLIKYCDYNKVTKNNTEKYYCIKCKNEKIKITNLQKYGVENVFQVDDIKTKIIETNISKYGVDYPIKLDEFKGKSKQTSLYKYGTEHPLQSDIILDKQKKTNIKKYGHECSLLNDDIIEKIKISNLKKYNTTNISSIDEIKIKKEKTRTKTIQKKYNDVKILSIIGKDYHMLCDNNCEHEFTISSELFRNRYKNTIICTVCNPINSYSISGLELEFKNFIISIYDGNIIFSNRDIIKPYEVDIYIPDLKIAFEFNGVYWHNELNKNKYYHKNKTKLLLEKGIQLIHVWEDDWKYKKDIVKSIIKCKIGAITNRIYARKCNIRIISNAESELFLENNHIQGKSKAKIRLGLFFNGTLVSLMTFSSYRISNGMHSVNNSYELLRFCNLINTTIVGGASKLFKYFLENYNPDEVISYANMDNSNGNLYNKLDFDFIKETEPSYFYVVDGIRQSRFSYRKDILVKKGCDKDKTEVQIMNELGYYRIFNSGNYLFKYTKK